MSLLRSIDRQKFDTYDPAQKTYSIGAYHQDKHLTQRLSEVITKSCGQQEPVTYFEEVQCLKRVYQPAGDGALSGNDREHPAAFHAGDLQ